jgi:hypothetical protein
MRRVTSVRRTFCVTVILLFAFLGMTEVSMGGSGFSEQGNALYKALNEHLVAKGVCKDHQTCHNAHQIYREDGGGHIYFNMYGQSDKALASTVAEFLVANGLKITGNMPITLRVFEGPKTQYLGFKAMINRSQESIKLEINK